MVEADPGWGKYQANTTRTLPVVALTANVGPPSSGGGSLADALRMIHNGFRHELTLIRKEVVTAASADATRPVAPLGAQLRINCLKVCQGLHYHHTRESDGIFPAILDQHPEATEAIERLQAEHDSIAVLLEHLQALLTTAAPANLLPELDRLTTALIKHLDYEEEQLLPLLGG